MLFDIFIHTSRTIFFFYFEKKLLVGTLHVRHFVYYYIKHILHTTNKINNYVNNNKSILIGHIHMSYTLYLIFISIIIPIIDKM